LIFYLHNLSTSNLVFEDIGLVVPVDGYYEIETPSLNDFLRVGSFLRQAIESDVTYTYGTDFVVSRLADETDTIQYLTSTEALPALTSGTASETFFENKNNSFLAENVQDAIEEVLSDMEGQLSGLTWRSPVLVITSDTQISTGGTIAISGLTFPLNDDETPDNITSGDLVEGKYILYKGATSGDDKLYSVIGTDLVEQTGEDGLNGGYAYVVKNDLLEDVAENENGALYLFTDSNGLQRIGSINWDNVTLQNAYTGGNSIALDVDNPFNINSGGTPNFKVEKTAAGTNINLKTESGGVLSLTSENELIYTDQYLTGTVSLSQSGITELNADLWSNVHDSNTKGNKVFDWSRTNSATTVNSIIGSLTVLRDDLNEYVERLYTPPTETDVDANGANLIGVKGIPGVTPTGGSTGSNASLQATLEGLAASGTKTYVDISSFTTVKSVGSVVFTAGETVYIQDVNRYVEIITDTTNIVEDTDWSYVGGENNSIGGPEYVFGTDIVLDSKTSSTSTLNGATYYDSDLSTLMIYDANRSKFVSVAKNLLQFGSSNANGQYLSINGVISGLTGFLVPYNSVITKISVIGTNNLTKSFEIRVNGNATPITSFSLVGGVYSSTNANFDISDGDYLQIFASSAGGPCKNVVATIELAYRK
jgi:hypothetical protein